MTVQCADIDECELGNACGTGSICTNTDGGYKCSCPTGFNGDPKVACVDVDECAPTPPGVKATPACGRSAICDNLPGTFRCQCPPGFKGDPKIACQGFFEFFFLNHHFSPSHNLTHKKPSNLKNEKTKMAIIIIMHGGVKKKKKIRKKKNAMLFTKSVTASHRRHQFSR